jgi:hypothetical protein
MVPSAPRPLRSAVPLWLLATAATVLLAAQTSCGVKPLGSQAASDAGASTLTASDGATPPKGVQCGKDPSTGITLCSGTTACGGLLLDSTSLPGCGFRTIKPSFDLECVCNGTYLCPIGVAATCDEITSVVGTKTPAEICNQVGTGACRELAATSTTTSTCDRGCAADCAGSAACLSACGC